MKSILTGFFLCLLLSFQAGSAENWVAMVETKDGGRVYIDNDSIVRDGDKVEYWQRNDDRTTQLLLKSSACPIARRTARALFLTKENCSTGTSQIGVDIKSYDSKGQLLVYPPSEPLNPPFRVYSPSSVQGILHKRICN